MKPGMDFLRGMGPIHPMIVDGERPSGYPLASDPPTTPCPQAESDGIVPLASADRSNMRPDISERDGTRSLRTPRFADIMAEGIARARVRAPDGGHVARVDAASPTAPAKSVERLGSPDQALDAGVAARVGRAGASSHGATTRPIADGPAGDAPADDAPAGDRTTGNSTSMIAPVPVAGDELEPYCGFEVGDRVLASGEHVVKSPKLGTGASSPDPTPIGLAIPFASEEGDGCVSGASASQGHAVDVLEVAGHAVIASTAPVEPHEAKRANNNDAGSRVTEAQMSGSDSSRTETRVAEVFHALDTSKSTIEGGAAALGAWNPGNLRDQSAADAVVARQSGHPQSSPPTGPRTGPSTGPRTGVAWMLETSPGSRPSSNVLATSVYASPVARSRASDDLPARIPARDFVSRRSSTDLVHQVSVDRPAREANRLSTALTRTEGTDSTVGTPVPGPQSAAAAMPTRDLEMPHPAPGRDRNEIRSGAETSVAPRASQAQAHPAVTVSRVPFPVTASVVPVTTTSIAAREGSMPIATPEARPTIRSFAPAYARALPQTNALAEDQALPTGRHAVARQTVAPPDITLKAVVRDADPEPATPDAGLGIAVLQADHAASPWPPVEKIVAPHVNRESGAAAIVPGPIETPAVRKTVARESALEMEVPYTGRDSVAAPGSRESGVAAMVSGPIETPAVRKAVARESALETEAPRAGRDSVAPHVNRESGAAAIVPGPIETPAVRKTVARESALEMEVPYTGRDSVAAPGSRESGVAAMVSGPIETPAVRKAVARESALETEAPHAGPDSVAAHLSRESGVAAIVSGPVEAPAVRKTAARESALEMEAPRPARASLASATTRKIVAPAARVSMVPAAAPEIAGPTATPQIVARVAAPETATPHAAPLVVAPADAARPRIATPRITIRAPSPQSSTRSDDVPPASPPLVPPTHPTPGTSPAVIHGPPLFVPDTRSDQPTPPQPEGHRVRAAVIELEHRSPPARNVTPASSSSVPSVFDTDALDDKGKGEESVRPSLTVRPDRRPLTAQSVDASSEHRRPADHAGRPISAPRDGDHLEATFRAENIADHRGSTKTKSAPSSPVLPVAPPAIPAAMPPRAAEASTPAQDARSRAMANGSASLQSAERAASRSTIAVGTPVAQSPNEPNDQRRDSQASRSSGAFEGPGAASGPPRAAPVPPVGGAAAVQAPSPLAPSNPELRALGLAAFESAGRDARALLNLASDDPSLHASALGKNAHIRLQTASDGDLSLHLTLRDGAVDVRLDGAATRTLDIRPNEVRVALAGEGISLGAFESSVSSSLASGPSNQPGSDAAGAAPAPAAQTGQPGGGGTTSSHSGSNFGGGERHAEPGDRWPDRPALGESPGGTTNKPATDPRRRRGFHVTA